MKATFEIIPHQSPWRKFWIFTAGCVTGAAGAIGGILIKERTEVKDGCVIFRHDTKPQEESPAQEPTFDPEKAPHEGGQGEGTTSTVSASEAQEDAPRAA